MLFVTVYNFSLKCQKYEYLSSSLIFTEQILPHLWYNVNVRSLCVCAYVCIRSCSCAYASARFCPEAKAIFFEDRKGGDLVSFLGLISWKLQVQMSLCTD
jgi:hypothetical protein